QRIGIVIVPSEQAKRLLEGLAAARVHVAVLSPRSAAVIEPRPGCAHRDFPRILLHPPVKAIQVLDAAIAAVCLPAALSRLHPGVEAVERSRLAQSPSSMMSSGAGCQVFTNCRMRCQSVLWLRGHTNT